MKLNLDCMRDVLLEMEKAPYGQSIHPKSIHSALSKYNADDIDYSIIKLEEAGFIDAIIDSHDFGVIILRLDDITYEGHQFLANIRTPSIWERAKSMCYKAGSSSIPFIMQVASQLISEHLGNLIS